jgi:hypothetical protein
MEPPPAACCVQGFHNTLSHYIFSLQMAAAVFAETLVNLLYYTQLVSKSLSCTLSFTAKVKDAFLFLFMEISASNLGPKLGYPV